MARKDEAKWKRIVASVKAGSKGGKPGQWSARKAQLATQRYKKSGGTYTGGKTKAKSLCLNGQKRTGVQNLGSHRHKVVRLQERGTYLKRSVRV